MSLSEKPVLAATLNKNQIPRPLPKLRMLFGHVYPVPGPVSVASRV